MAMLYRKQQGMALFISLIFLLLLTSIGVVAMRSAVLQEKMAGNAKFKNESLQYAEAGLREGEGRLASDSYATDYDTCVQCSGSGCRVPDWSSVTTGTAACGAWHASVNGDSHFYIQKLGTTSAAMNLESGTFATLFRVTAVATVGGVTSAVESVFAKY